MPDLVPMPWRLPAYAALAAMGLGLAWRLGRWARTPAPFRFPLAPLARDRTRLGLRLLWQALAWPALWRSSPGLWLAAWLLHLCLLLVLLGHLRHLLPPSPAWLPDPGAAALPAGLLLAALAHLLLMRRLADPLLRRFSNWRDYLSHGLLLAVCLSGLYPRLLAGAGSSWGSPAPTPCAAGWLHYGLGCLWLAWLPWVRLLHAAGPWASPGPSQLALGEGQGHPNPWDDQASGPELSDLDLPPGEPLWWTPDKYRAALKQRWSGAGVHRVMGAGERRRSLAGKGQDGGEGAGHGP